MSGHHSRLPYDECATQQYIKQSTSPINYALDPSKYINVGNICKANYHDTNGKISIVDVESGIRGLDKNASQCNSAKHPNCNASGCLLTNDKRLPPHVTPYACERGRQGDNAVITTNMKQQTNPGFHINIDPSYYKNQNGYYSK